MPFELNPSHRRRWGIILWLGIFLVTACTGVNPNQINELEAQPELGTIPTLTPTSEVESEMKTKDHSETQEDPTETVAKEPTGDITSGEAAMTDEPTLEPTPVEREFFPSTRTQLEATDPATVNLASGQLQLVELFAFW